MADRHEPVVVTASSDVQPCVSVDLKRAMSETFVMLHRDNQNASAFQAKALGAIYQTLYDEKRWKHPDDRCFDFNGKMKGALMIKQMMINAECCMD